MDEVGDYHLFHLCQRRIKAQAFFRQDALFRYQFYQLLRFRSRVCPPVAECIGGGMYGKFHFPDVLFFIRFVFCKEQSFSVHCLKYSPSQDN